MKTRAKKNKGGRPPRRDNPVRIDVRLPGEVREWLRRRAAHEGQHEGDLIAALLARYRKRVEGA